MKRFLLLFLISVLLLTGSAAANPVDLSGMSFDQLVALRDQLNLAIWNCQEWQEVTVPAGVWVVGKDIPAGHWSIKVAGDYSFVNVSFFDSLGESGRDVGPDLSVYALQLIASPGLSAFGEINAETVDFNLKSGWYFKNDGAVIFTPYAGKPDLGFK